MAENFDSSFLGPNSNDRKRKSTNQQTEFQFRGGMQTQQSVLGMRMDSGGGGTNQSVGTGAAEILSDDIVKVKKGRENLCGFTAMYNSLRTAEERFAFSAGNTEDIALAFVEHIKVTRNKTLKELTKQNGGGYNQLDFGSYLRMLKKEGWIKEFVWKNWDNWILFKMLNPKHAKKRSVLLFGYSVASDKRTPKRFRRPKLVLECNEFEHFNNNYKGPKASHAVALGQEANGKVFLYDDGMIKRKDVTKDVAAVADRIAGIWKGGVRAFSISV